MIADAMIEVCLAMSLFLCPVWPVRAWLPVSARAGPAGPAPAVVSQLRAGLQVSRTHRPHRRRINAIPTRNRPGGLPAPRPAARQPHHVTIRIRRLVPPTEKRSRSILSVSDEAG